MSINRAASLACGLFFIFSPAFAFDVTRGEVSVGHSLFTDNSNVAQSRLEGSVELGFSQSFGVQVDARLQSFNLASETSTAFALHGLFHLSQSTSAGIFLGTENFASDNNTFYGAEVGTELSRGDVEGYIWRG